MPNRPTKSHNRIHRQFSDSKDGHNSQLLLKGPEASHKWQHAMARIGRLVPIECEKRF